jgi:hypothetical protein
VRELSWFWIAVMATVPPVIGTLFALAVWRSGEMNAVLLKPLPYPDPERSATSVDPMIALRAE